MTDDDFERLEFIFYNEAPYDYVLSITNRKRKYYRGSCEYNSKVCQIYGPEKYTDALITMLHEIAHARIQHKSHSETWEKEFIYLLDKHNVPKPDIRAYVTMTPNMTRFVG